MRASLVGEGLGSARMVRTRWSLLAIAESRRELHPIPFALDVERRRKVGKVLGSLRDLLTSWSSLLSADLSQVGDTV